MPSTEMQDRPTTTPPPRASRPRLQLSATQLIASALAAVTATIAASYLGVNGTVIGAAVASVVSVIGNAVYSHSIRQTGERVRTVVPPGVRWSAHGSGTEPGPQSPSPAPPATGIGAPRRVTSLRVLAVACAGVFAAVLVLVTGVELVAGRPLSDLLRGKAGQGTSFLGNTPPQPVHSVPVTPKTVTAPVQTPTITLTPKAVTVTPTVTAPATTVTPTSHPASSPATTATTSPTPGPTHGGAGATNTLRP